MYDRAPRNIGQVVGSTPFHVGPGTYDISKGKRNALESYAPFQSLAPRNDIFTNFDESPGPGQYDVRLVPTNVKGGTSVAFREQRFRDKKNENPGPGTYTHNKDIKSLVISTKPHKHSIKINRKKNAPSIQDPKYAYGFEENQTGELIPQKPPERDPTIGPAYYNANATEPLKSDYKGIHFSKYSSKRTEFGGKFGPGPADYDTLEPVKIDVQHYNIKAEKKPELQIARYPEDVIKYVEKEQLPGPGKYEQKRLFDSDPAVNKPPELSGMEYERPPFGVQSKRFDSNKSVAPGPGTYNEQRSALSALTKIHGLKNTPFLQSAIRFGSEYKVKSAPGPGQYKISGFVEDNIRRAIVESGKKPAFGNSAPRKFNLAKKDEYVTPGPAQYQIKEKPFKPKHENLSSNFASTSRREYLIEETPGPTAYNVPIAFENLQKLRREPPRNKNAQKRHESFITASKRDLRLNASEDVPGPGTYDVQGKLKAISVARLNDERWKDSKEAQPGPADYELSPLFQDTVLKGTFNATLNNPFHARQSQTKITVVNKAPDGLQVS